MAQKLLSTLNTFGQSPSEAFEALVCLLAGREKPEGGGEFRRIDGKGGDGGVEAIWKLPDGTVIGYQAKFFDSISSGGRRKQIENSFRTALNNYKLRKYIVALPFDLNGRKASGQSGKSQDEKWEELVDRCKEYAEHKKDRQVEIELWSAHDIKSRLLENENKALHEHWLGERPLDDEWFSDKLTKAITSAGPRYTPRANVKNLEILREFDVIARNERFIEYVRAFSEGLDEWSLTAPKILGETLKTLNFSNIHILEDNCRKAVATLSNSLNNFDVPPNGPLCLASLCKDADEACSAIQGLQEALKKVQRRIDDEFAKATSPPNEAKELEECQDYVQKYSTRVWLNYSRTQRIRRHLDRISELANANIVLLRGDAGVGKTHFLCDVAQKRVEAGAPAVLLLGQRFSTSEPPERQIPYLLDFDGDVSWAALLNKLEGAAQTQNKRALIIIDAINEGCGAEIWPLHLHSFIAEIQRSDWVGIVMSVRSPYEDEVLPEDAITSFPVIEHTGFLGVDYRALKPFYEYYGVERSSIFIQEMGIQNPLILTIVCKTVGESSDPQIPGINNIFQRYVNSIDKKSAALLNHDPKDKLFDKALSLFAAELVRGQMNSHVQGEDLLLMRWGVMDLDRGRVKSIVDEVRPTSQFNESLYRALIDNQLLTETERFVSEGKSDEIVSFGFQRIGDYYCAKDLLDRIRSEPESEGLCNANNWRDVINGSIELLPYGWLEQLWIQVSESLNQELDEIMPSIRKHENADKAFAESLVWRTHSAINDRTFRLIEDCLQKDEACARLIFDALLRLSFFPKHQLNAEYLDALLRSWSLVDRDARWTRFLNENWKTQGIVDQLLTRAEILSQKESDSVTSKQAKLIGRVLSWMLTSSNRFVRDRVTKVLVVFFERYPADFCELVNDFSDVDDLYISERLYAVAYGIALRTECLDTVKRIAEITFETLFKAKNPPPHILLRDYAAGTILRALQLGVELNVERESIIPPFRSEWPGFPDDSWYQDNLARFEGSAVERSVYRGDFDRYVLNRASYWFKSPLKKPWKAPLSKQRKLEIWRESLTPQEKDVFAKYEYAQKQLREYPPRIVIVPGGNGDENGNEERNQQKRFYQPPTDNEGFQHAHEEERRLYVLMSKSIERRKVREYEQIDREANNITSPEHERSQFRDYIMKRLLDLGWTPALDEVSQQEWAELRSRTPQKPERIGKKYQWIFFHELLALLADHFEFRDGISGHDVRIYESPQSLGIRDIDPSCLISSTNAWSSGERKFSVWWAPEVDVIQDSNTELGAWVRRTDDLPSKERVIASVKRNDDADEWLNLSYQVNIRSLVHAGESGKVERDLWFSVEAYLVESEQVREFRKWVHEVHARGDWLPEQDVPWNRFLGEYLSAPITPIENMDNWLASIGGFPESWPCGQKSPIKIIPLVSRYLAEGEGYDCSIHRGYRLNLPTHELRELLKLKWAPQEAGVSFVDENEHLAMKDPSIVAKGPSALLLRKDLIDKLQMERKLTLCWTIVGTKTILEGFGRPQHRRQRFSGVYVYNDSEEKESLQSSWD